MSAPVVMWEGMAGLMAQGLSAIMGGANNSRVRLFGNNYSPTAPTSYTDFLECSFAGYAAVPVPTAVDQGLNFNQIDIWAFDPVRFTMSAPPAAVAYGYWIDFVNPRTHTRQALWAQRFNVPFAFLRAGDFLPVVLTPGFSQG